MRNYGPLDIEFAVNSFEEIKRKMDDYANSMDHNFNLSDVKLENFRDVHVYWLDSELSTSDASRDIVELDYTPWVYNNFIKFLMVIGVFVTNQELLDDTNNQGVSHDIFREWDIMFAKHRFNLDDETTNIMRI
jgi:hypothetical protein